MTAPTEPASPTSGTKLDWRAELLSQMRKGIPLRKACELDGMPHFTTVYDAIGRDKAFAAEVAEARVSLCGAQQDALDDYIGEALEIKDPVLGNVRVQALKLASDILKFKLVKVLPKLYGDRPQTEVNVHNTIGIVCDEKQRATLIAQREELLLQQKPVAASESRALPVS